MTAKLAAILTSFTSGSAQQLNELADLTEHYYERSYWRDEKYRL